MEKMSNLVGTNNEKSRKDWLEAALNKLPRDLRILDAGAGELANKKYCNHLNYVSQDFCQYKGVGDNKGLQTGDWDTRQIDIVSDISHIPEADASFDVILCSEVFEHLPDPVLALREFQRLLKKDGVLILTAPFCSLTHFAPYHFSTGFNRYFYEHHLKSLSFEVTEISTNGNYFEYMGQELRRIPSMADKYTSNKISRFHQVIIRMLLKILERLSSQDKGSDELLCFGYHVVAKKL
jgi:ubiquinone/menaquinone biosynthesis C-methylase UbiE